MSETHGTVHWTELMTRDPAGAMAFYGEVCGWSFMTVPDPSGAGDYHLGLRDGQPVVGIMDMRSIPGTDGTEPYWMSYFAVDDLDAAVAHTQAAGGTLLRPVFEVPGTGHIALAKDPTGALIGLMKPEPMTGGTVQPDWVADSDAVDETENFPV